MKHSLKKGIVIFFLLSTISIFSQSIYKVPLDNQVQSSSQIVEGKVILKASFWDNNHQNIYTVNTIEVYKIFKGIPTLTNLEVITKGGVVGLNAEVVTPSLELHLNDIGVFMLKRNTVEISNNSLIPKFQAYASLQGFYKYDLSKDLIINPYNGQAGISEVFYNKIRALTKKDFTIVNNVFSVEDFQHNAILNKSKMPITSFTPTTVTAGTQTTITITGNGFGATQGVVGFRDANFGGQMESPAGSGIFVPVYYDALDTQVLSWTDTQIVVEVPYLAGTGDIQVTDNAGSNVYTSAQTLTIAHSELNIEFNIGTGTEAYDTRHVNRNANGGYVWQMQTDFDANTAANESFMRAFDTWRCETGVYWEIGAVTTTDVIANDNVNVIRFDNGAELPEGILGQCISRFSGCGGATIEWYVEELDIVFEDVFTGPFAVLSWQFGPAAATGLEVDFESVAVHELGHGHQLGHVIAPGEVMHYQLTNGLNVRTPSALDIAGANNVHSRSTGGAVCGQTVMMDFDCAVLSVNEAFLSENLSVFPNPAKSEIQIKNTAHVMLKKLTLFDVNGRLLLKKDIDNLNALNIMNLNTINSGLYFLSLETEKGIVVKKLLVE